MKKYFVAITTAFVLFIASTHAIYAVCDGWATDGSTHRNAGNGCTYRCSGSNWSGPISCDGQGNGQFQGEAARNEEERRQQAEAVAQRNREAEQRVREQGQTQTQANAATTAEQRAREAARQQAMVESQRQNALQNALQQGASAEELNRISQLYIAQSQQVAQAQGTNRGQEIVGSDRDDAAQIAREGYDPNSYLATGQQTIQQTQTINRVVPATYVLVCSIPSVTGGNPTEQCRRAQSAQSISDIRKLCEENSAWAALRSAAGKCTGLVVKDEGLGFSRAFPTSRSGTLADFIISQTQSTAQNNAANQQRIDQLTEQQLQLYHQNCTSSTCKIELAKIQSELARYQQTTTNCDNQCQQTKQYATQVITKANQEITAYNNIFNVIINSGGVELDSGQSFDPVEQRINNLINSNNNLSEASRTALRHLWNSQRAQLENTRSQEQTALKQQQLIDKNTSSDTTPKVSPAQQNLQTRQRFCESQGGTWKGTLCITPEFSTNTPPSPDVLCSKSGGRWNSENKTCDKQQLTLEQQKHTCIKAERIWANDKCTIPANERPDVVNLQDSPEYQKQQCVSQGKVWIPVGNRCMSDTPLQQLVQLTVNRIGGNQQNVQFEDYQSCLELWNWCAVSADGQHIVPHREAIYKGGVFTAIGNISRLLENTNQQNAVSVTPTVVSVATNPTPLNILGNFVIQQVGNLLSRNNYPPKQQPFQPSTVFVDMPNQTPLQILSNQYGADRIAALNLEDFETRRRYLNSGDEELIKITMAYEMLEAKYGDNGHGVLVTNTHRQTLANTGAQINSPTIIPLTQAMSTRYYEDKLGNPTTELYVDPNKVNQLLDTYFAQNPNQTIVNMSFLVGTYQQHSTIYEANELKCFPIGSNQLAANYCGVIINTSLLDNTSPQMTYYQYKIFTPEELLDANTVIPSELNGTPIPYIVVDGIPTPLTIVESNEFNELNQKYTNEQHAVPIGFVTTTVTEAYNDKLARQNLADLITVAQAHPGQLFVTAGGNDGNYFYQARQDVERQLAQQGQEWPNNLIIVGVIQDNGKPNNTEADGADIYIQGNDRINSTSEATAVVTAIADIAEQQLPVNISPDKRAETIRDILLSNQFTDQGTYIGVNINKDGEVSYEERTTRVLNPDQYPNIIPTK